MRKVLTFFSAIMVLGMLLGSLNQPPAAAQPVTGNGDEQQSRLILEGKGAQPYQPIGQPDLTIRPSSQPLTSTVPNYRATLDDNSSCNNGPGGAFTSCSQQEPHLAVNPTNSNNVVAAAKDWRPTTNEKLIWIYTTFDGGATWINQPITYTAAAGVVNSSDTIVQFDALGNVYVNSLVYNATAPGNYVVSSTNGGLTWSTAVQVDSGDDDKNWMAVDNNPTSPFFGRLYVCWWDTTGSNNYCSYSSNRGATWSARVLVGSWSQGFLYPVVNPNGFVYIFFKSGSAYRVIKSTDGGVTWGAATNAVSGASTIGSNRAGRAWRVNSMQAAAAGPEGNLYLVWLDTRNNATNGWDIYYTRSTDGGTTWSVPTRLNDDPTGLVRDQFEPAISVAPNGRVDVQWSDMRDDPANTVAHIYYTNSTDRGATFASSQQVSTAASNLSIGIPADSNGSGGDYNGIASHNDGAWMAWTDTRNSAEDIYAARVPFTGTVATPVATASPVVTSTGTATAVVTNTATATAIVSVTVSPVVTVTTTVVVSVTVSPIVTGTSTATAVVSPTASATVTGTTGTPTATATACGIRFSDVPTTSIFYNDIQFLACRGIVNGTGGGLFSPAANATRGQFAKIAALAFAILAFTPTAPSFRDVAASSIFYQYIEAAAHAGVITGLTTAQCAALGVSGPCFGPNLNITRAQVALITQRAKNYPVVTPTTPTFVDVPASSFAYGAIETLNSRGIISGAACGSNRCFRPNDSIRRDELSRVVYNALR